jgi:hypothetical protein
VEQTMIFLIDIPRAMLKAVDLAEQWRKRR